MASIEPRGNGSWRVTISCGYDELGKQIRIRRLVKVDPSKTELAQLRLVEREAALLEADYSRHLITDAKRITVTALCDDFYDDCRRKGLSSTTINGYRKLYEKRLIPYMGRMAVQDVSPRTISDFHRVLSSVASESSRSVNGKLSGTTKLHYHRAIHSLFSFAVRMQYISVNPVDSVEPPRKDTPEARFYELSDCARLLEVLDGLDNEQWRLFYYLSIYTGMRPGEIIGLDWQDIDFEKHLLTVRAGCAFVKGVGTVRTDRPKTQKSVRMIDLPANIMELLEFHKQAQDAYKEPFGEDWPEPNAVFTSELGKRLSISLPTQHFQRLVKEYNLPPISLYGLRHTAATIMIAEGLNAREVAARLGHAQTSTTLNIYAHAFQDANTRATNAIANALNGARARKDV